MDVLAHLDSDLSPERSGLVQDGTQLGQPPQQLEMTACR